MAKIMQMQPRQASIGQRDEPDVTQVRPAQATAQRADEHQAVAGRLGEALQVPAQLVGDRAFTQWFTSAEPGDRYDAAKIVAVEAPDGPRTVPAVIDRLEHDPSPHVRKRIAARVLPVLARDPRVLTALHAAADTDEIYGVRWAARFALRTVGQ